ncbi:MAG: cellulase family glycosylhydrolase [Pseudomonadota bacterium]
MRALLFFFLFAGPAAAFPVERCINLSNFLEVQRGEGWSYPADLAHIDRIADVGFDTLRLPVNAASWWRDGRIDPRFEVLMLATVERARAAGLFVIVDLHHFTDFIDDPSAHGDRFVAIWVALAEALKGQDGVAFELLNEAYGDATIDRVFPHYMRALASIRSRHPEAWVIFGGGDWNHLNRLADLPASDDPRIVHTFHYYSPFEFTHQKAEWIDPVPPPSNWNRASGKDAVEADMARAAAHPMPVFLGEFGAIREAPRADRLAWIETVRRAAEAEGIPWCHWGFGARFRIFDPETETFDEELLEALLKNN